jgi:PadR family transcriptional regulator PadR
MEHSSQLLKGVLDMCLLAVIKEEPSYGYEMAQKLTGRGLALVSDGSIYPSLSRLQKRYLVEGYLVASQGGPPRKYYRITEGGKTALLQYRSSWHEVSAGVKAVLEGGKT